MFTERRSHSSCKAGDFIYVCGGINSNGESLSQCEKYSLAYEKWMKIAPMNITKSHLSICSVNDLFIYSIGGENKFQSLLDNIEKYNIQSDKWEILNVRLPIKIECPACVHYNNEVLILGGFSSDKGSSDTVYSLDINKFSIQAYEKKLDQPGWSIYQPIKIGRKIHIFYGGEEGYPPHHLLYEIL
jgi:N-acetylneuraminic acid mutarotase